MAIDLRLVPIALDRASGADFENFCNAFFSVQYGATFVPLGGMHDGGADAFLSEVSEDESGNFIQATIRPDHDRKIVQTLQALRKSGRSVTDLVYATSRQIPFIDKEERGLSRKHGIRITIRDRNYFQSHINDAPGTIAAFTSYLAPLLSFLKEVGSASLLSEADNLPAKTLCVFLGQEIERRRDGTSLLEAVTDSLVLWALRDTDPDKNSFMTRDEVLKQILQALPSAKQFIRGTIDQRLAALASKTGTTGREVRRYRRENKYCLPYETRQIVQKENEEDEVLKNQVAGCFSRRLAEASKTIQQPFSFDSAISVCFRVIELTFQNQGIEVSHFLEGDDPDTDMHKTISDHIDTAIELIGVSPDEAEGIREAAFHVMRMAFYQSEEVERIFLNKLCRTFCLLFTLRNHPHIVEYFRSMSSRLVIYVGADLIIRALSEHFLKREDAMTCTTFEILRAAKATLIVSDRCLEEVITHIISDDREYKNHYQRFSGDVTFHLARQINRILIRTFFYGAIEARAKGREVTWSSFIGQFLTYSDLYMPNGRESLKRFLGEAFGFEFETEDLGMEHIDQKELQKYKAALLKLRKHRKERESEEVLAENDAFHALRVYAKRQELQEGSKPNPYGYRTWWLTQETLVLRATSPLVRKWGAPYMMRPEFLLNFIALAPELAEVRKSFETIFPTLIGVQLSNRMRPSVFKEFVGRVNEAYSVSDPRARAMVSEYSDKLKADQFKRYTHQIGEEKAPKVGRSPSRHSK